MTAYPSIGSISSGSLRTEDLLTAFATELEYLVQRNADTWCTDIGRARRDALIALISDARELEDFDSDEASELLASVSDELNLFAPDYCYFGANEGDGSDFGFWLAPDWQQQATDDCVLMVSDLSDVPDGYRGLCAHINDHGNAALYAIDADDIRRELWSIV